VGGSGLRAAGTSDLARISRTLVGAGLFSDERELAAYLEDGAWRIQVGERGVLVAVERWRVHLDILSMRAVWCAASRVPSVVRRLRELAGSRGFGSLVSPAVAGTARAPYEAAGMRVAQELVSYGTVSRPEPLAAPQPVRPYGPDDFERVCEIDAACFDDFWRYDPVLLKTYLEDERSTVVECEGTLAGFAFYSVRGGEGVLGRIAVEPGWRGRGAGLSLAHEATSHMLASGAGRVGLCTQADNARSRLLYSGLGFAEDPERLFMLVSSSH